MESTLKSAALLEQMKKHLETDAGKELKEKVGLVYQLNISPKVSPFFLSFDWFLFYENWRDLVSDIQFCLFSEQKIGFNEEIFVVDLKEGKVSKGFWLISHLWSLFVQNNFL